MKNEKGSLKDRMESAGEGVVVKVASDERKRELRALRDKEVREEEEREKEQEKNA